MLRCPKELRGRQIHNWMEEHKPEIIQLVQQKGKVGTALSIDVGLLAVAKTLTDWGLPPNFGAAAQERVLSLKEEISQIQAQNAAIRLELDPRLVSAGVTVSIRLVS